VTLRGASTSASQIVSASGEQARTEHEESTEATKGSEAPENEAALLLVVLDLGTEMFDLGLEGRKIVARR